MPVIRITIAPVYPIAATCDVLGVSARNSSPDRWRRAFRAANKYPPQIRWNRVIRRALHVRRLPPIHVRRSSRIRLEGAAERPSPRGLPARFRANRDMMRKLTTKHPGAGYCAIYARFSTSKQTFDSIDSQLDLAREVARKLGLIVRREYSEAAKSGTNVEARDVFQAMMRDAKAGLFQTIIVYDVARFARTWRPGMDAWDELADVGVTVQALDKILDEDSFLEDLRRADKNQKGILKDTQRGRLKKANGGRRPLGPAFGYQITPGKPGIHTKHIKHADTVGTIFGYLDNGYGATTVAHILTKEGCATPRDAQIEAHNRKDPENPKPFKGAPWTTEMVIRISRNALYKGEMWYNTTVGVKDRRGRKLGRVSPPEEEWACSRVPDMRIVDDELYDRVQNRPNNRNSPGVKRPPRGFPFSKLVTCDVCGQRMKIATREHAPGYLCENYDPITKDRCPGSGYHNLQKVDRIVLEHIVERANDNDRAARFRRTYVAELERLTKDEDDRAAALQVAYDNCLAHSIDLASVEARNDRLDDTNSEKRSFVSMKAAVRAANEAEKAALDALNAFDRVTTDADTAADLSAFEALFDHPDMILDASGADLDGGRAKMALRRIVVGITLGRVDKKRNFIRLKLRLPDPEVPEAPWPATTCEHVYDKTALRQTIAAEAMEAKRIALFALARSGAHGISDEACAIAEACATRLGFVEDRVSLRLLVDALMFHAKENIAWKDLPAHFGTVETLTKARQRLVFNRVWDAILDAWDAECPGVYAGTGRRAVAYPGIPRRIPLPTRQDFAMTAPEIRAVMEGEDERVRLRMTAVAMYLEGQKPATISSAIGIAKATIGTWLRKYCDARQATDFHSSKKEGQLTDAEVQELKKMIADSKSEKKSISLTTLYDYTTNIIKVDFASKRSLSSALYRNDIFLFKDNSSSNGE